MTQVSLVSNLLTELIRSEVPFVHWKSNEHLVASLRGDTDLDLLVDNKARDRFAAVVADLGFLPMLPPREREIAGLESFLGMDSETGKLIHLDVHFRVVLGEQFLKNHHLPVEDWLLRSEARLEGVAVPEPEQELLLLYVRCVLKTRSRQIVRAIVKGGSPLPQRIRREAIWLAGRCQPTLFAEVIADSRLPVAEGELAEFRVRAMEGSLDWRYVLERRRSLVPRFRRYQRMPWYRAGLLRIWLRLRNGRLLRRLGLGLPRRRLAFSTPLIAAVGADGSGKTRLTRDLEKWLETKLMVEHIYFGQPKSGVFIKALNKPGSIARHRAEQGHAPSVWALLAPPFDAAKWLVIARRRRRLAMHARGAVRSGVVVLAERFPLSDFHDMETPMDGPRLQPDGILAGAEMAQYRAIEPPDLTLVLDTSLTILRDRKLDLGMEEHSAKVEAVKSLEPLLGRVVIDAGRPYAEVLLEAKRAIWEALVASS